MIRPAQLFAAESAGCSFLLWPLPHCLTIMPACPQLHRICSMRTFLILACIILHGFSSCPAQSVADQRSGILYVIGRVSSAAQTSCVIDVGGAHTIDSRDQLAVFRSIHGHFRPIERITVTRADTTTSHCINRVHSQPDDIVMVVREFSQLYPGPIHRERIVRRRVVRSYRMTSSSTVNNVRTANALSNYELQFPAWQRSRADVVGRLLSASLQESADDSLRRLTSQINLMRRLYQQDAWVVDAAGAAWATVMPVLAGPTAEAGYALRLQDLQDRDESADDIRFAAGEIRRLVFHRIYQLQPEQQNTAALIVASLMSDTSRDATIAIRTAIDQSQFPNMDDDEQFMEDVGQLVLDIRDRP